MSESEYARSATADDLKSLVASLNANGVEYLLIGGYALYAHGYQRAMTDIDILVQPTIDAGKKVRQAFEVGRFLAPGYAVNSKVDNFADF